MKLKLLDAYEYDKIHNVLSFTLNFFGLRFTDYKLKDSIESHPDTPSLSTIKDILSAYGIESTVIRKGNHAYEDFQTPFICLIKKDGWSENSFSLVTKVENGMVEFLDTTNNQVDVLRLTEFERIDEKIILLMDDAEKRNELDYEANRKKEKTTGFAVLFPFVITLAMVVYSIVFRNNYAEAHSIYKTLYLLSFYIGTLITALLIWQEVDSENPFFKKICGVTATKKTNCNVVLSSSGSKFMGLSWSIWGFSYFLTLLISQVLWFNYTTTIFIAITAIVVSPYILYSIYYQLKVVKKWCALCLMVQLILAINLLFGLLLPYRFMAINWNDIGLIVWFGILIVFFVGYATTILKKAKRGKLVERKWQRLRYNGAVFNTLLQQQPKVNLSAADLGIVIGDPNASIEIIKVCNPYCEPCAVAHQSLFELMATNKNIKLRIIFFAKGANDSNTLPVILFLSIAEKFGVEKFHEVLHEWFLGDRKNYKELANTYPIDHNDLSQYMTKAQLMSEWSSKMGVKGTPTFFINGYQLPEGYNFTDFKYLF